MSMVKASINQIPALNDYYMGGQEDSFTSITWMWSSSIKGLINIFYASGNVDPRNAIIQFGDNDKIRLYRFMGETIAKKIA